MSHGIEVNDKGFVGKVLEFGGTWHGVESYKEIEDWVTVAQATSVLDYPINRRPLFRMDEDGEVVQTEVYEAYRPDTGDVLIKSVTKDYDITSNVEMLKMIDESVLKHNKDVHIESVGTLFNGQTAFINLMIDGFEIKGDESPHHNKIMYFNPLGKGSYRTCAHSIRIVCNNTLQAAAAQGASNDTITRVRHTKNAQTYLNRSIIDLTEVILGFKDNHDLLTGLTQKKFDTDLIREVVERNLFTYTPSKKSVDKVIEIWDRVYTSTIEEYTPIIRDSRYVALQSFTNLLDAKGKSDYGYRKWDGIVGHRSRIKNKILADLVTL